MTRIKATRLAIAVLLACAAAVGADQKDKAKTDPGQTIDSGSFGVYVRGQRMLTETFSVQQGASGSVIKAQLKEAPGAMPTSQQAELEITPSGALERYQWSQSGNMNSSLVVLPNNEFLIEKVTTAASSKPAEQPFLMPNTSMILDNNFFIQREVLAWRYLAAACKQDGGNLKCQKDPVEFGALVPQERSSMRVRMGLVGKEKVTVRGAERELLRLNLNGDGFDWALWVDDHDQFKLVKVEIPADNTEVVRD